MRSELICGCKKDGTFFCESHRRPRQHDTASDPIAIVSLALFVGTIAVWAAILG